ncbi:hypothetical protein AJ80_05952 [Polytolypa hystricis UAMH7299]|uniref:Potassium channel domain-containing protein n=1 Tax=Polytolypa hystricis (strain UAMH7299) TaxID=1447883 RepID=A0A2B7Y0H3_POLH7|nr:hypothetical protein AJ80_05952 [Polytolypa hystricis UAMH7299]
MGDRENTEGDADVHNRLPQQHQDRNFESVSFLFPTRWWFASTVVPLLAVSVARTSSLRMSSPDNSIYEQGTFGPTANAFNICALAQDWRIETLEGGSQKRVQDPKWLLAANSVALGLALISNFSLLLNMARRIRFSIAQPITVGGWFITSFILIGLTAAAPRTLDMEHRHMSQTYYYAIIAAAIYFFISSLMLITVYGARTGRYSREFHLTTSQRSLMLQTIIWLVYLLGGAAIYAHIEGWDFVDAVYWADFTLLTDGIGDLAPSTHLGRALLFPYAVGGILTLTLVVTSIRSLMLERGMSHITARRTEVLRGAVAAGVRSGHTGRWVLLPLLPDEPDLSEEQRQEEEFYLMRRIHRVTLIQLKWFSLLISLTAWMALWFLGALAFWISEQDQDWSYFLALYFAYVNLLTIGYGEVAPQATWGRPFFVLWSLLAIPTMTILVSSMGDTIADAFQNFAIFAGELTVLPGEMSYKDRIRTTIGEIITGKFLRRGGWFWRSTIPKRVHHNGLILEEHKPEIMNQLFDDPLRRQYVLIRELRKLYHDLRQDRHKMYTYNEWLFYLTLTGQHASCSSYIMIPPAESELSADPTVGHRILDHGRELKDDRKWSWIGKRSPLMGEKEEAEWLFDALSLTLEYELRNQCESP